MALLSEIRKRRVIPWIGGYLVTGFVVLEAADQLVGNGMAPALLYPIVFVFYVAGFAFTGILAWYHGEKGSQETSRLELSLLGLIFLGAVTTSALVARNQLTAPQPGAGGLDPSRIAVLYLEDLSAGEELGHVADGLTEALIDQLSQVRSLDVISRNGVGQFRDTRLAVDSIASVLQAGTVVNGSVEAKGDQYRVSLRVIDGESGTDLQRTSLELPADQILALQDSVAQEVSRSLREWLGEEVRIRDSRARAGNSEAWTAMQRAERARKNALEAAVHDPEAAWAAFAHSDSLLAGAQHLDPDWVEPVVLEGDNAYRRARLEVRNPTEMVRWIDAGLDAARRALDISENDPAALELRGTLSYFRWLMRVDDDDGVREELFQSARGDLENAVAIDPTRANAHSTLSHLYYQVDDIVSAVLSARLAYEEDTYLAVADVVLVRLYNGSYDLAQFNQARRWCDEGSNRFPDDPRFTDCDLWLMITDDAEADVEAAWASRERLLALTPEDDRPFWEHLSLIPVGGVIARAGMPDSANAVLLRSRAGADVDPTQELMGYEAAVRAVVGDREEGIDLLKRYIAANPDHSFDVGGQIHWWWSSLTDHPEFQAVRERR